MNTRIRYTACLLLAISIAIALLLAQPDVNRSRAKARASGPIASSASRVGGMEDVPKETTFTPPPAGLKTWVVSHEWHNDRWNCPGFRGGAHAGGVSSDVSEVLVGYVNSYDGGSGPLPCESNSKEIYQGTIWFDLSEIFNKPPFPRADTAILKFKKVAGSVAAYDGNRKPITKVCADRLFVSNGDSMKGFPEGTLVPEGDLLKDISECPPEGCSINVTGLVNNWITGKIDRDGFVIAGEDEEWVDKLIPHDSSVCQTRYSDFSLTVKYRYSKTDIPPSKTPPSPGTLDTRKNVALASNEATATAQDYTRDEVYPGSHFQPFYAIDGLRYLHLAPPPNDADGFWRDEHGLPSWLQINFAGSKTIEEVDVYTVPDYPDLLEQKDPPDGLTFKSFGVTAFDVQYWDGMAWKLVYFGSVGGRGKFAPSPLNDKVRIQFKFKGFKVTTDKIRVLVNASPDTVARIVEVEAWTP
jgi:hypothetical protein